MEDEIKILGEKSSFHRPVNLILDPSAGSTINEAMMEAWNIIRDNQNTIGSIKFNFNDTIIEIYMKNNAIWRDR